MLVSAKRFLATLTVFLFLTGGSGCSSSFPDNFLMEYSLLALLSDSQEPHYLNASLSGTSITETGEAINLTLSLSSEPKKDVIVRSIQVDRADRVLLSDTTITFNRTNWSTPKVLTVSAVNNSLVDGDEPFSISFSSLESGDTFFDGSKVAPLSGTVVDDDTVGFLLSGDSSLIVSEAGRTDSFTVQLSSQPAADVSFNISSDDLSEGSVSPSSMTFTSGDWNQPQTITVTGLIDSITDDDQVFNVVLGSPTSSDPLYNGLSSSPVQVTCVDVPRASGIVTDTGGALLTNESGTTDTFTVSLLSEPLSSITIATITSSDTGEVTVTPTTLTFDPPGGAKPWNVPQTITVQGIDDSLEDGDQYANINLGTISAGDGAEYKTGTALGSVAVLNLDDDSAGFALSVGDGLTVRETGTTDTFSVVLKAEPASSISIGTITSSDIGEVTVSPVTLTFDPTGGANPWNVPQTVTIKGLDDAETDGSQTVTINLGVVTGGDGDGYPTGMSAGSVTATNIDNEIIYIVYSSLNDLTVSEGGTTTTFSVRLNAAPASDVVVGPFTSDDSTEALVTSPAGGTLTFTPAGGATPWNVDQSVTITGQPDDGDTGASGFTIDSGSATSTDPVWDGVPVSSINGLNYSTIDSVYSAPVTTAGAFVSIFGSGTVIPFTSTDNGYASIPIGFTFQYNGTNYTDLPVSTKGNACFIAAASDCMNFANENLFQTATPANVVAPWWDGLKVGTGGEGYYEVSGAAPSRILTVEWNTFVPYSAGDDAYTFQLKLYEASNNIQFVYGPSTNVDLTNQTFASIGIKLGEGGDCLYFDGISSATGPSCSGTVGDSTLGVTDFPVSGTIVTFTAL